MLYRRQILALGVREVLEPTVQLPRDGQTPQLSLGVHHEVLARQGRGQH